MPGSAFPGAYPHQHGLVPALDVDDVATAARLVEQTTGIDGIAGYKLGAQLALADGLAAVVRALRGCTDLPLVYDHQKVGLDLPTNAAGFARAVAAAQIDGIILFPVAGPSAVRAFVAALLSLSLTPIVGAALPVADYYASQGGYVVDDVLERVASVAVPAGVRHLVVPGNAPGSIAALRREVEGHEVDGGPLGYLVPGITPGATAAVLAELGPASGFAVVGRAIHAAADPRAAAARLAEEMVLVPSAPGADGPTEELG